MHWEYLIWHVSDTRDAAQEELETIGKAGWEMVSVDRGVAFFKRPKAEPEIPEYVWEDMVIHMHRMQTDPEYSMQCMQRWAERNIPSPS